MQVARPRKKQDAEHRVLTLLLFNEKHIAFRTTKTHRRSQIPVRITPSRMRYGSETHRVRSTLFVFWFCYSSRNYLLTCKSCLFSKTEIYAPDFNSLLLHKRKNRGPHKHFPRRAFSSGNFSLSSEIYSSLLRSLLCIHN